ncbi:F-box only protein 8 [Hirschfeldia incana]|nr:F-box only protein 8 [Hirschfeldia incana]
MKRSWRRKSKRGREMEDSNTWVAPKIPLDLLIEILARLPAKSIMRFKCISKFWSSLLCSSFFCDRFMMLRSPRQPRLYMSLLDKDDYSKSMLLSSAPSPASPSSIVFDQDLTIREMGGYYLRAVRGFIGFTVFKKEARIYNPSTRQLIILPAVESNILAEVDKYNISYFICYDPLKDQYKVLCTITVVSEERMQTIRSERWVLVLEAGGSWKRVAKDFHPHFPDPLELTMNGVLYYLGWTDSHTCVLVSFDISSEEFSMLQVPRKPGDVLPMLGKWVATIDYGGKVAVFDYTYLKESGTMDLWVVEDWRKQEWSMKTLALKPSQMHLVTDNRLKPKGTMLKGKIVLVPLKLVSPFYFLCYDLQTNDLKKVGIKGIPNRWFSKQAKCFDMEFMDPSDNINYLDT